MCDICSKLIIQKSSYVFTLLFVFLSFTSLNLSLLNTLLADPPPFALTFLPAFLFAIDWFLGLIMSTSSN